MSTCSRRGVGSTTSCLLDARGSGCSSRPLAAVIPFTFCACPRSAVCCRVKPYRFMLRVVQRSPATAARRRSRRPPVVTIASLRNSRVTLTNYFAVWTGVNDEVMYRGRIRVIRRRVCLSGSRRGSPLTARIQSVRMRIMTFIQLHFPSKLSRLSLTLSGYLAPSALGTRSTELPAGTGSHASGVARSPRRRRGTSRPCDPRDRRTRPDHQNAPSFTKCTTKRPRSRARTVYGLDTAREACLRDPHRYSAGSHVRVSYSDATHSA